MMAIWEYKIVDLSELTRGMDRKIEKEIQFLNTYGNDGWELINVIESMIEGHFVRKAYLKREKQN